MFLSLLQEENGHLIMTRPPVKMKEPGMVHFFNFRRTAWARSLMEANSAHFRQDIQQLPLQ